MACDTSLKAKQTIQERAEEVRTVVAAVASAISSGRVKVRIGPQGAIAFDGITASERDGVTDACIYRRIMVSGSLAARSQITKAEMLSGRAVNRQVLASGVHSHDGGRSWHNRG